MRGLEPWSVTVAVVGYIILLLVTIGLLVRG